jgi:hypothetical protein
MAKHSQLHLMPQEANGRPMTKAEAADSQDSNRNSTATARVVIDSNGNDNDNITDLESYHLTRSSILPIAVRAFDAEEDLEHGARRIRPRESIRLPTDRDNVPIAMAVPMAVPLDEGEGEAWKRSTKSPSDTLPPTTNRTNATMPTIPTPKPTLLSPPISMWSLDESSSSSSVVRGTIAAMCGLTIFLAWAVIAMLVSNGIRHHHHSGVWG